MELIHAKRETTGKASLKGICRQFDETVREWFAPSGIQVSATLVGLIELGSSTQINRRLP